MSQGSSFNDQSTLCHICNTAIPKPFILDHMKSSFHINNYQIIDNISGRFKGYIKVDNNNEINSDTEQTHDEFCDVCSISYSSVQKFNHISSDHHKNLVVYTQILPKICILFKDVVNNLDVIDELREILNEREETISNESNEHIKSNSINVSKEIYQNPKESYSYENVDSDEYDIKDTSIDEASQVSMQTQEYSVNDSKPNKEIEETPCTTIKHVLIQKISEIVNELNKTNLNQKTVTNRPFDMIYCDICNVHKTFKGFNGHLRGKTHRKKSKELNVPEQFPKSKNVRVQKTYCDVCDVYKCMEMHCESLKHKKKVCKKLLANNHYNTYITDTYDDGVKYCRVCKVVFNVNKTINHIENTDHLEKYKKILRNFNITKVGNDYFCPTCDVFDHDIVKHVREKHKTPLLFPYETFCEVCRIKVPKRNVGLHNQGKLHADNIKGKEGKHFKYIDIVVEDMASIKEMITVENCRLKCKVCDAIFSEAPKLMTHIQSDVHNNRLKNFYMNNGIETLSDNEYGCNYCQKIIKKFNVFEHINVKEHKEKIEDGLASNSEPTIDIGETACNS
ncbi:hypothetical protein K1T71_001505 [Dendrolimus kikuchii]|uniref:Uncharacterized protein n=1 Tax=Dendrolimus kikuchii TaxID=765133 RepID=A0ACC1DHT3_9NEOP|nr:hypothetical protein K1T71_001505 [Dendrolimus kikuchii]